MICEIIESEKRVVQMATINAAAYIRVWRQEWILKTRDAVESSRGTCELQTPLFYVVCHVGNGGGYHDVDDDEDNERYGCARRTRYLFIYFGFPFEPFERGMYVCCAIKW